MISLIENWMVELAFVAVAAILCLLYLVVQRSKTHSMTKQILIVLMVLSAPISVFLTNEIVDIVILSLLWVVVWIFFIIPNTRGQETEYSGYGGSEW